MARRKADASPTEPEAIQDTEHHGRIADEPSGESIVPPDAEGSAAVQGQAADEHEDPDPGIHPSLLPALNRFEEELADRMRRSVAALASNVAKFSDPAEGERIDLVGALSDFTARYHQISEDERDLLMIRTLRGGLDITEAHALMPSRLSGLLALLHTYAGKEV